MVEGEGSKDYEKVRKFALKEEKIFSLIMDKIIESSVSYLSMQVKAGADVIQIFDSWAGVLSEAEYKKYVIKPTQNLVQRFKALHPTIPVIGFPRGSGTKYGGYAQEVGIDAVSVDVQTPMLWARDNMDKPLQGNLDPVLLAGDKNAAVEETKRLLEIMDGKPFIFNLGHGILQSTPVENVSAVCDVIKSYN
jgi:uroporphyrinogen decarboxylase